MACRSIEVDDELIELLKCESENKNTKRSTGYWKGIFEKWAKTRGKEEQLESYDIPELNEALSQFYAELAEKRKRPRLRARLAEGDAGGFRSTFKKQKQKFSKVYPEGYRVPVFEESVGREGEKAARTRDGKTTQQSKKPDEGRRGDTMAKRPVRQPNPSLFDKHNVVAANNAFRFMWSTRAPRHDGRRFFHRKG